MYTLAIVISADIASVITSYHQDSGSSFSKGLWNYEIFVKGTWYMSSWKGICSVNYIMKSYWQMFLMLCILQWHPIMNRWWWMAGEQSALTLGQERGSFLVSTRHKNLLIVMWQENFIIGEEMVQTEERCCKGFVDLIWSELTTIAERNRRQGETIDYSITPMKPFLHAQRASRGENFNHDGLLSSTYLLWVLAGCTHDNDYKH